MTNKTCPQCGVEFTCGISAGESSCWCFDLPNVIPLDSIATSDDAQKDCLCSACLQAKIEAQKVSQSATES